MWWRLKSPASPLFTQPFIQALIEENIKALHHWPLCGEFTGDRWLPYWYYYRNEILSLISGHEIVKEYINLSPVQPRRTILKPTYDKRRVPFYCIAAVPYKIKYRYIAARNDTIYPIYYNNNIQNVGQTSKSQRHPIPRPYGWVMVCRLGVIWIIITARYRECTVL